MFYLLVENLLNLWYYYLTGSYSDPIQINYRSDSHKNHNLVEVVDQLNIREGYYDKPPFRCHERGDYQTFSVYTTSTRRAEELVSFVYTERYNKIKPYQIYSTIFKDFKEFCDMEDDDISDLMTDIMNEWIEENNLPIQKYSYEYIQKIDSKEFTFDEPIPLEYNMYKDDTQEHTLDEFERLSRVFMKRFDDSSDTDTQNNYDDNDSIKLVHAYQMLRFGHMIPLYEYPYGTNTFSCMILHNLITDKSFRNKGFASHLINSAIRYASESDVDYLVLYVSIDDKKDRLITFFEKFGFLVQPNDSHLVKSLQFDRKSNSEETEVCMSLCMK